MKGAIGKEKPFINTLFFLRTTTSGNFVYEKTSEVSMTETQTGALKDSVYPVIILMTFIPKLFTNVQSRTEKSRV